ncbi:MAG: DUF3488 and transglutaminase-like domain-containing protein [Acidimicrobiales bacterium]|jgi:transglutaminase-like putative cysteine protease|nr:DUF3488 and transglutaminase-like domain-containing protein [Acidimicrobiales bacterium]
MPTTGEDRGAIWLLPAEVALVSVTIATAYGFSRIFEGWSFLGPLLAVGLATHAVTMLARRRGWSVPASFLATTVLLSVLVPLLLFTDSTFFGVPTAATLEALDAAMSSAWSTFQDALAPVPASDGLLVAAAAGLAFAVFLADWAAFRLWSRYEALVPAATLFVFCSLLGGDIHRLDSTALWLLACGLFLLLHRIAVRTRTLSWLTRRADGGGGSMLTVGVLLAVAAVAAALLVGPQLPGADEDAVFDWRQGDEGPGSRVTISPLVDIRDRLDQLSDVEVFTVRATEPAYWRMTSLDTFDGTIWRSGGRYAAVGSDLDGSPFPAGVDTTTVVQEYEITGLSALWVPAAFEPRAIDVDGSGDVRFQAASSTVIVDTDLETSDGLTYTLTSEIPSFTPEQLAGADTTIQPTERVDPYLQLPADFEGTPADIRAEELTRAASSDYDKALALQEFFRTQFEYSLDVGAGHSGNAMTDFLTQRKGYCEQFAGTFAAMARSVGIPARVAVGFTWGEQDADDPELFRVRGEHAHAWPEVWLGEYGWVPFEPTPGRGAPSAEQWTMAPPAQGPAGDDAPPTPTSTATSSTTVPGDSSTTAPGPVAPRPDELESGAASSGAGGSGDGTSWFTRFGRLLAALAAAAVAYVVAVVGLRHWRHRRRLRGATDPASRVDNAWQDAVEELALVGSVPARSETHREFASRAGRRLEPAAGPLGTLAEDADAAAFAGGGLSTTVAERAESAVASIRDVVRSTTTRRDRWVRLLDPRTLASRRRGPSDRHQASSRR